MNRPKCRWAEAVKNATKNQKQRFKCKQCGCNYTQSTSARIPLENRVKVIKLYLEGVRFRGIERLTGIHLTTVIKWVKNLALVFERSRPELSEQVMTVELDKMWHFIQKNTKMLGLAGVGQVAETLLWLQLGRRNTQTGKQLWQQLNLFENALVCTDYYSAYQSIVPFEQHVVTKAETWCVESLNGRIRHYLIRFRRKTSCYSKALHMVQATLTLFFTSEWEAYLY